MLNTVVFIWSVLDLPQVCESHTVSVNSLDPTTLESKVGGVFFPTVAVFRRGITIKIRFDLQKHLSQKMNSSKEM